MELKPCPFCGCKDIRKLVKRSRADIWCNECGVNMAMSCFASYSTLSDADKYIGSILVKNWNRRTPEILKVETNIYDKEEIYPDCTNRRFHIPDLADICMSAEEFCCLGERKENER